MLSYIYRIKFTKSSFELNDDYDMLSDYEKEKVSDLDADSFFDYDEDNGYICYVITSQLEIKSYLGILKNNLINVTCDNLSKDVLTNKVDLEIELGKYINSINSGKYSLFIDELNEWLYLNLDMDTILDRISESGINSLKEVEKLYLDNFKLK